MDIYKEELQLLGVNKASIAYDPNGKETGVKMLFKYAPIGTTLFFHKIADGRVLLLKQPHPELTVFAERKVQMLKVTHGVSGYISMKNVITMSTHFSIYEYKKDEYDGFYLEATCEQDKINFAKNWSRKEKSGSVDKFFNMAVNSKDRDRLMKNGENLVLTMYFGEHCYAELTAMKESPNYPSIREIWEKEGKANYAPEKMNGRPVRTSIYSTSIQIPKLFVQEGRIKPDSQLITWFAPGNKMIIEVEPVECKVCKKPIRRYNQKLIIADTCKSCVDVIPTVSDLIQRSIKETSDEKIEEAKEMLLNEFLMLEEELNKLKTLMSA